MNCELHVRARVDVTTAAVNPDLFANSTGNHFAMVADDEEDVGLLGVNQAEVFTFEQSR